MSGEKPVKKSFLKKVLFVLKILQVQLRFVIILVVTALVVGYWDHIQNYYERWERNRHMQSHGGGAPKATESEFEYFCGMHPFVVREQPGKCPICGMALTQRKKGAPVTLPEGVLARVQVSPERVMQAGVRAEPVAYRLLSRTVRSYAIVEVDETRQAKIIARFPGRIEELMVNTTGAVVKKGEPLTRIYSPKFLAASQEYVRALEGQRKLQADAKVGAEELRRAELLVTAARQRLSLSGFTEAQLNTVAQSSAAADSITLYSPVAGTVVEKNVLPGESVEEGTILYSIADLSTLWVQARIVETDIAAVKVGMPVEVTSVAWPGVIFYGNVSFIYPTLDSQSRTVKVRVAVPNPEGKLRPGMYVSAVIRSPLGQYGEVEALKAAPTAGAVKAAPASGIKLPTTVQADADAYLATLGPGAAYYVCPMDQQVVSDKADECPLCNMKLVEKKKSESGGVVASGAGSDERWAEGYSCAMHPEELSDKPGICVICGCGMTLKKTRIERVLSLPETAVIDTGTRRIVYAESAPGIYDAHAVTLGPRSGAYYQVLDGLTLGQRIATNGSFLIDAEARLNPDLAVSTADTTPASASPQAGGEGMTHQHGAP